MIFQVLWFAYLPIQTQHLAEVKTFKRLYKWIIDE